jgi:hypothetical protein
MRGWTAARPKKPLSCRRADILRSRHTPRHTKERERGQDDPSTASGIRNLDRRVLPPVQVGGIYMPGHRTLKLPLLLDIRSR